MTKVQTKVAIKRSLLLLVNITNHFGMIVTYQTRAPTPAAAASIARPDLKRMTFSPSRLKMLQVLLSERLPSS